MMTIMTMIMMTTAAKTLKYAIVFSERTEMLLVCCSRESHVNDNEASMTSTVNRGRRIVSVESTDATDIITLAAKTKRAVFDTISSYNKIEFSAQVNEKLLNRFMQKVALNIKDIQDNYIVTSCAFDCRAGATAELEARKVVLI